MKAKFFKNRMFYILLTVLVLITPNALTLVKQIDNIAVVTALGVDIVQGGEIEVSAQMLVPKFEEGFEKNVQVVFALGKNMTDALNNLRINLGKDLGLSHLGAVVISSEFAQQNNLGTALEPLLKNRTKNTNAILISTPNSARELLQAASSAGNPNYVSLHDILAQNNNNLLSRNASLQNFFIQYYTPQSTNMLGVINVSSEGVDTEGQDTKTLSPVQLLYSDGSAMLFKQGQKNAVLSAEQLQEINWFNKNFKTGVLEVQNVVDDTYDNADVTLSMLNKEMKFKVHFYNNIPRLHIDIKLELKVEEVSTPRGENLQVYPITKNLSERILQKVKQEMAQGFNRLKAEQIDPFSFYKIFYVYKNKAFKQYLDTLGEGQSFIDKLELYATFEIVDKSQITLAKLNF